MKSESVLDQIKIDSELLGRIRWIQRIYDLDDDFILERALRKYWHHHNNKTMLRENKHRYTHHLRRIQEEKCYYCKKLLTKKNSTLDHKLPLSRGGLSNIENLCLACGECNLRKSDLTEEEYFKYLHSQESAIETLKKLFNL